MESDRQMTFFQHFEELRRRLFVSFLAILIGTAVSYTFAFKYILPFLKKPVEPLGVEVDLHYLSIIEPFMAKFKLAILVGIFLALPVICYQFLAFIAPALQRNEKKFFYPLVLVFVLLFLAGAFVSYSYIMPLGAEWLIGQAEDEVLPVLTVSQYISFAMLFLLAFGLAFETPLVIVILVKVGIVPREVLRKNWRVVYVVLMILAAIATPDWSLPPMLMLSAILIALYELSMLVTKVM